MRVLGLALYGPLAASTRHRMAQYTEGLARAGIELRIQSLLGDEYLRRRFAGGGWPVCELGKAAFSRLTQLVDARSYDAAMVHCELFPLLPGGLEAALVRKPYLYDFDDAFYLRYRTGRLSFAKPFLGAKFDEFVGRAAVVTAGSRALHDYAAHHNRHVRFLPTVVDTTRYVPDPRLRGGSPFTIGWIGSPSTSVYLRELVEPISALAQEGPVRLVVIGGPAPAIPAAQLVEIPWKESEEAAMINSFDVGLMPLLDDEWSRAKCAFKLIQYMACGVPVVASPVGANNDVVTRECGLLAATAQEWTHALRCLRDNPGQRRLMGEAGRDRVLRQYALSVNLPILVDALRETAGGR
ncbi:glycosyltransferase family 4 protein [Ramlibacter monticola]|uniref:Glycosyltransferase family 4 protein n=1 Tax=Ramlibacter monticola TaxID=1926872 RepID=A0A936Z8A4_9BURK|nr:glycosyltransferase family 4 protein [Ramlibacter monticola]MBL0395024.1 glycosyltransferase family 4 protein [Ramlibacter monticola]